ncbi:MAG TPA: hypothetical protein VGV09_21780, partial [Steroidobacteraceae bacterium]|nr:hypothetical protein [Steroidobacteraceae bacterium]
WNGTGMINLNSLVTNQIPTTLNQAIGINDNGWIVADGGSNGSSIEAYLLVPNSVATAAPEIDPGMAGTALTLLAGFAAIMGGRRRPGRR